MFDYNKPDLNAPRFRPESYNVLNTELYKRFIAENPKFEGLDYATFKAIIYQINDQIWQTVIKDRNGVELPEQLGNLFIGSCQRKKGPNPDHKRSAEYGKVIQNRNWESDDYVAKIFYTNCETKYRFKNHDFWGFTGVRQFKRAVAHSYPENFKKYIEVENTLKISRLFRKIKNKTYDRIRTHQALEHYDEFAF